MNTQTFTFAVSPTAEDGFDGFLLEVPTMLDEDAAARRAWWAACSMLSDRGIEPEDFRVCVWRNGQPGPLVTSGGILV